MRYLYIGEIAELLGVSKDTIRIYEEQGLIFPVRDENGFRRYTEEDPDRIICYLNAEYDLKKSLEKPERCYLLIKEPEARYLGRQDLMEMSERIEGGSMVRAIQHTEKLFPDGELFAAAARAGTEFAAARARDNAATIICLFFIKIPPDCLNISDGCLHHHGFSIAYGPGPQAREVRKS